MEPGATAFDTPIGVCTIAWSAHGVTRLDLPPVPGAASAAPAASAPVPRSTAATGAERLPPPIRDAIDAIHALLSGAADDLRSIPIDIAAAPAFQRRVWEHTRTIGPGAVRTYGEVAAALGEPGAARAVGRALGANPVPLIVPCHRVLASGHGIGGFSAPGGAETKRRLLGIEGARRAGEPELFDG